MPAAGQRRTDDCAKAWKSPFTLPRNRFVPRSFAYAPASAAGSAQGTKRGGRKAGWGSTEPMTPPSRDMSWEAIGIDRRFPASARARLHPAPQCCAQDPECALPGWQGVCSQQPERWNEGAVASALRAAETSALASAVSVCISVWQDAVAFALPGPAAKSGAIASTATSMTTRASHRGAESRAPGSWVSVTILTIAGEVL